MICLLVIPFSKHTQGLKRFFSPLQYEGIIKFLAESAMKLWIQKSNVGNDCNVSIIFLALITHEEHKLAFGEPILKKYPRSEKSFYSFLYGTNHEFLFFYIQKLWTKVGNLGHECNIFFCLVGNFDYSGSSVWAFMCAHRQYFKINNCIKAKTSALSYLELHGFSF